MPSTTPVELDDAFADELNRGNLEGLLALHEKEAVQIRQDGSVARGSDEIREVLREFIAMQPRLDLEVTATVPIGDDVVVVLDRWRLAATVSSDAIEMEGTGIHLVRQQADGDWLFVATGLGNLIPR